MGDKFKEFLEKAKENTKILSSKAKKLIIAALVLAVVASVGIAVWLNNKPYTVLFTGLNDQESSELIGKLQTDGITYKYENGGTILVPSELEQELKAKLVYEGYPSSGFTYDIYRNNIGLTTTESEKEYYKLLELQDRMGDTIRLFPNIKDAKVTIALGDSNKYVIGKDEETEATASVTITTKNGDTINEDEVLAIQRLVSKSIPKMQFTNVAVLCNGEDVSVSESSGQLNSNELKLQIENAIDEKIRQKVINVLEPIYGEKNIEVSVNSVVDINKKIRELINYSAEDPELNKGVLQNVEATQELSKDGETVGGIPGTETNSDIPIYTRIEADGTETYILSNGSANYLVDQLKEQEQVDAGDLIDLSIAVIINGNDVGATTKENITSLVARASGISPDVQNEKIEILAIPFYVEEPGIIPDVIPENPTSKQILILAGICLGILLLFIILIIIILKRRKKKKKKIVYSDDNSETVIFNNEPEKLNLDLMPDLLELKNERSIELKNRIREMTEDSPEISAQTLKNWLRGGGD